MQLNNFISNPSNGNHFFLSPNGRLFGLYVYVITSQLLEFATNFTKLDPYLEHLLGIPNHIYPTKEQLWLFIY